LGPCAGMLVAPLMAPRRATVIVFRSGRHAVALKAGCCGVVAVSEVDPIPLVVDTDGRHPSDFTGVSGFNRKLVYSLPD
jgi:hypothetical protein